MKNRLYIILLALVTMTNAFAQEAEESKKDNRPVRSPFENGILLDNYTTLVPNANTMDFVIQHRFGTLNSEGFDLIGLYAPSNIRIGLNYGITKSINVGIGTTKRRMLQDLNLKYKILEQTRSGSIPVSVSYFGLFEYDARDKELFGIDYQTADRLSYFHELMVSRKFNDKLTLQASFNFSHLNQIDTTEFAELTHENYGFSVLGRYKVTSPLAIIFSYNQTLSTPEEIKPAYGLGVEIGTSAHAFQVFFTTADAISRQRIQTSNVNDIANKDIMLGFNITRTWFF